MSAVMSDLARATRRNVAARRGTGTIGIATIKPAGAIRCMGLSGSMPIELGIRRGAAAVTPQTFPRAARVGIPS